jgi:hypothetical protein
MANLKVTYCIVCEDIRPEAQGKHAILGFFGLLPDVNIKLKEIGKPVARLAFLVNVGGGPGKYNLKFSVVGPDKKKPFPDVTLEGVEIKSDPTARTLVVFNMIGLVFAKEGPYTVKMIHGNKAFYESTFSVEQGPDELFRS